MSDAESDPELTNQWGRELHDLFVRALQVPEESREEFMRTNCKSEELREHVIRLLHEDELAKQGDFLSLPKTHPFSTAPWTPDGDDPLVGQEVGDYRIEEWIASGGMGSVYRATRVNDFRHSVALKVARHGFGSDQELHRFTTERQILADLNHPFIAQILDGGTTPQGQPYFVMEYIQGRPIDGYCFEENVALEAGVALFVQVCRAVQHAHERGVIHRDIKPSNILVNDDGIPKLTDFGIARLVEEDSEQTPTGLLIGTPSYTSPEQASGRRIDVGPISDVFSLGAVLYKVLTGKVAFRGNSWKETIDLVCMSDPVPPRAHNPDVPVELQSICLKCLEKEPLLRYESARHLADDLQRWLDGRPVLARPVGRLRRWARSIRRERWTGIVTLAALMAVCGVVVWMAWTNATIENSSASSEVSSKEIARHAALLASQRERTRRLEFNEQLSRIHELSDAQPNLAQEWLFDPVRCPPDLRGFAWGHLLRRTSRHLRRIDSSHLNAPVITFLPGDEQLATLTQRQLHFLDIAEGIRVKERKGPLSGVVFLAKSADGSVLLTPRADREIALFRLEQEETNLEVTTPDSLRTCAAVTDAADRLAIGSAEGMIELWDIPGKQLLASWEAHAERVYCLGFSSDGRTLVSYGRDLQINSWDVSTGSLLTSVRIDVSRRQFQEMSRAGDLIAVGELYGTVSVWECVTGTELLKCPDNGGGIPRVTLSPDGREVAAAVNLRGSEGALSRVLIWTTHSAKPRLDWTMPKVAALSFSNDGNRLATVSMDDGAPSIDLWDVRARTGIEHVPAEMTTNTQSIAWLADDEQLMCGSSDGSLTLVDVNRPVSRDLFRYENAVRHVAVTEDGQLAAAAVLADTHVLPTTDRGRIPRPLVFQDENVPRGMVNSTTLSPNSELLAAGSRDGAINIWKIWPQHLHAELEASDSVAAVAFSPDGQLLASGGRDRNLTLWNVKTRKPLVTLEGHTGHILCIAFSPTEPIVASAGRDGIIRLWDLQQGKLARTLSGHSARIVSIAFTPDGSTVASGGRDRTIRIWDVATGSQQLALEGHEASVVDVEFSRSGQTLASCDERGVVRLWRSSEIR